MVVGALEMIKPSFALRASVLGSIVVSISACHAEDRGSIPRRGEDFFPLLRANMRCDAMPPAQTSFPHPLPLPAPIESAWNGFPLVFLTF